ncbi:MULTISPECIES: DUF4232 domain-containing protein [Streptomyces]|uniref:DUF4232 domain-containing protein n=1 Tax=Streptomyces fuscus TaxID=3048495 RepID=A0ABT7JCA6_9ACTN|nr:MULTISPECIES: DUF4232 domain-containing protein [Streptomyces]MCM1977031.1 DUF4232 domain-containing protein [Streptomyces sp. G1]MDL2081437.1 DUF4232 domain-containing protein [Streptomyces fuscus]SBT88497.1 Protein of unknown function [Streptomyces sp. DI166]
MRTFRHARLLAATGAALAALALTACDNGTGTEDEGRAEPSTTRTAQPDDKQTDDKETGGQTEEANKPNEQTAQPSSDADSSEPVVCNGSNTKVTAQTVSRPLNHMLLTVTNTGSKPCSLPYYPLVRFDEMQWAPQVREDSQPQAVPTLAPGESGYAGVMLSAADGSGENGTTAKQLTVGFQGMEPGSDGGATATAPLPKKGVYYDSALTVTYWQQEAEDALN